MERKAYPTDLTDAQWQLIEPLIPIAEKPGRPRFHPLLEILNAIFYIIIRIYMYNKDLCR